MEELYHKNEYMFHMVFTNNYISRQDIHNPLKTATYYLNGPEGIFLEFEDTDLIYAQLFISYNTAEVVNQ